MLSEPNREADPTRAIQHPGQSGPQGYAAEPVYPPEFTEQPWAPTGPPGHPPQGPPGYPPTEPQWPPMGPPMGGPPPAPGGSGGGARTAVIALIVVLLVAGIGVGIWFLVKEPKSSSKANGQKTSRSSGGSTAPSGRPSSGPSVGSPISTPPPTPRVPPPFKTGQDSKEVSCEQGFPDPSKTEWASHAGRGNDSTTCAFAKNVLDAYWLMGPPDPALRKVSAAGTVSCAEVSPDQCDPSRPGNFVMECQSKESPDWITCVGGKDALVFLY